MALARGIVQASGVPSRDALHELEAHRDDYLLNAVSTLQSYTGKNEPGQAVHEDQEKPERHEVAARPDDLPERVPDAREGQGGFLGGRRHGDGVSHRARAASRRVVS